MDGAQAPLIGITYTVSELPTAHIQSIPKVTDIHKDNISTTNSVFWSQTRQYSAAGFQSKCIKVESPLCDCFKREIHTSECPLICTATSVPSTAARISRCAWTNCVSRCRQCRENALRSSTFAITDSCSIIFVSNCSTDSAYNISIHIMLLRIYNVLSTLRWISR